MKSIGIIYSPSDSLFYSSVNQTALLLSELFTVLGYTVTLLDYKNSDVEWWSDFPKRNVGITNLYKATGLDWLIDIDGRIGSDQRKNVAKHSIVFLRTFLQFTEMDSTVYIDAPYRPRDMKDVSEIWCWDILNPVHTIPSIQTLFNCPIRRVPFIWSNAVASHYVKERTYISGIVHVAEKNIDNQSSCILPIVAIRELVKHSNATYKVHNMDAVKENRFFKENVANNIEIEKLPIGFCEKEPYYNWVNDILFSHSRFTHLRIGLLNAIWMGIPVVHNSSVIRDLHPACKSLFYNGNDVKGMISVFKNLNTNPEGWYSALQDVRDSMTVFGIESNQIEWQNICQTVFSVSVKNTENTVKNTENTVKNIESVKNTVKNTETENTETEIIIAFEDMWPGFNYDSNFIMDALRHEQPSLNMKGVKYEKDAHLLIFGPYSTNWKSVPNSIPKVFFSAENWKIPQDPSIKLYITSSSNIRIPTWVTFIDWFSNATELPTNCEDNPIRLPLHFAMNSHAIPFKDRKKFCGFVVSNPTCQFRNEAFHIVNDYKQVTSGGALFNNIGGQLSLKYPGGGCGDISKHHFFAEHKFTLSFENSQATGYVTEKLLHAKMAGCIPLYWGDNTTDFVPNSFVNLSNIQNPSMIVDIIKKLEANPDMCEIMAQTPLLNEEKKQAALTLISNMCKELFKIANIKTQTESLTGIDKTYVINLDTRPDRWDKLMTAEPYLSVTREHAVNGRQLKMTKEIYDMFDKNQFQWKKSVIGCNLSHISVWSKIAKSTGSYYLVLEDDVRFTKGWHTTWKNYVKHIPKDADLLYLGGVLPPNKVALPLASESYNEYWSYIKPNTFFTTVATPVFHFCAYSYILTPKGAQKLMDHLYNSESKSFTVSDHLLGHPSVGLKKYHTSPLLSYCFQEEDPVYVQSQFNDLHRKDTFDSDLWNNTDCFSEEELAPFRRSPLNIYYMEENQIYEKTWIEDLFQVPITYASVFSSQIVDNAWYLVQRPNIEKFAHFFHALKKQGISFKALHISDEFGKDPIEFYSYSNCKAVIRMYLRDTIMPQNVITIPLGYHHKYTSIQKSWTDRELLWSFHGTNWFNRKEQLDRLSQFVPFSCNLQPDWNHPTATKETQYLSLLGNSKFCPIMRGHHSETFRLYEALEAGSLPIIFTDDNYTTWIDKHLNLSSLYDWKNPEKCMNDPITEEIRQEVVKRWNEWKKSIQEIVKTVSHI